MLSRETISLPDEEKTQADSEDANLFKDTLGSDTLDRSETLVSEGIDHDLFGFTMIIKKREKIGSHKITISYYV